VNAQRAMALVLLVLVLADLPWLFMDGTSTVFYRVVWNAFLFGIPVILIGFLLLGARWALVVGVMYGTIALALDISTIVQELTSPKAHRAALMSGITAILNFLLIIIGGRGFLDVSPSSPPAGRPPNPPLRRAR
jgi:hypothetical protein